MSDSPNLNNAPRRPEDILPDHDNCTEINGVTMRKGTVAAFLQNAVRWSDPTTPDTHRDALAREIAQSVPALRALGVLTVFEARDERLRSLMDSY